MILCRAVFKGPWGGRGVELVGYGGLDGVLVVGEGMVCIFWPGLRWRWAVGKRIWL